MSKNLFAPFCLLALTLALSACGQSADEAPQMPLAKVRIETLQAKPLSITSELSGRIAAPRIAEVRARVAGVVMQRVFNEGHDVKQGGVLFILTRRRSRPRPTSSSRTGSPPSSTTWRRRSTRATSMGVTEC